MSAVLLAVVLALVLGHVTGGVHRLRNYDWFIAWADWLLPRRDPAGAWGLALVLSPLLLLALLQWGLGGAMDGVAGFVFAVAVLFYSWGPRDLDRDAAAVLDAPDLRRRDAALHELTGRPEGMVVAPSELVDAVFQQALRRWFGVLLWFLLLGPFGALGYRLVSLCAEGAVQTALDARERDAAAWILRVLDWPVAQLMTLALALVGDFDRVLAAWRDGHADGPRLDTAFLGAAARASVAAEIADAPAEDDGFGATGTDDAIEALVLADAMRLLRRVLLVWLLVLALFVLAGWVN